MIDLSNILSLFIILYIECDIQKFILEVFTLKMSLNGIHNRYIL